MRIILTVVALWLITSGTLSAQESFPVNGVQDKRVDIYAFTNATIYVDYETKLEDATLLIQDGLVVNVGTEISIPKGAIIKDLSGKTIYPAFVDPYSDYGMPEVKRAGFNFMAPPQLNTKKEGAYGWNEAVKAEINAADVFTPNKTDSDQLRKAGFGAVVTHHPDGIVRGSSALVTLGEGPAQNIVIAPKVGANYSFDRASSAQSFPNSIMGAAALIRQTHYDGLWYQSPLNRDQVNLSLQAFNALQSLPQVIESTEKHRTLLADKIGDEFGKQFIVKGAGDEYQRIKEIKATGTKLIIPVDFPDAYDVDDPYEALNVSIFDLKHWEMAPKNPAILADNSVPFAFTTWGMKDPAQFIENVRKSVQYGLSETEALKALTYNPASFLGITDKVGSLKNGVLANFTIMDGNVFDGSTKIYESWIKGVGMTLIDMNAIDHSGDYQLALNGLSFDMEISGTPGSQKVKVMEGDSTFNNTAKLDDVSITLIFNPDGKGDYRLSGFFGEDEIKGEGQKPDGSWINWTAMRTGDLELKAKTEEVTASAETGNVIYPFVAFGSESVPKAEAILIKNATVWTNEEQGIMEEADVLIENGKIKAVGRGLSAAGVKEVDGTGKHLTPGIIDEHSHTALFGVNEASQAITAEVRMYDAVDSDDIDIYRQLAGGVTAAQLLHGSANPVGGQSALIKFRWGLGPDQLAIEGADGYIKFALGENVKQSNRPPSHNIRFPQTRMGVEQVFVDGFTRARAYDTEWKAYNALSSKVKASTPMPRKDLELEILAEILNKERFISCHSYVQSEINMLMKVAEQFDFRVNTFTHILEGYKVADKMAEHGVGGSTFADWWAYKFEVREAIPYNATLMNMVGVVTAINSDDSEMARRLNQEAAKSIKYGDMPEEEALKMVTLNPAKLLHLDDRMGSIKVGKDADLVLWSNHPLSIYAKAEKTIVDGVVYFDIVRDKVLRETLQKERARIIAKMRDAKNSGKPTKKPRMEERRRWECEDVVDYVSVVKEDSH